jgi:hypothetical protein
MRDPNEDLVGIYAGLLRQIRLPATELEPVFSVEKEKVSLGIDELIFHLAAVAGQQTSKKEVESEIDQAIVSALEGLNE